MSEGIADWIAIAEDDLNVAEMAYAPPADRYPSYYAVCYHCQQCCEKYLKAFLLSNKAHFPKTHDLVHLVELCLPYAKEWESLAEDLQIVKNLGMQGRYPGDSADAEDAKLSLSITHKLRDVVRDRLL
jgi:HEPN domain-containing protein